MEEAPFLEVPTVGTSPWPENALEAAPPGPRISQIVPVAWHPAPDRGIEIGEVVNRRGREWGQRRTFGLDPLGRAVCEIGLARDDGPGFDRNEKQTEREPQRTAG